MEKKVHICRYVYAILHDGKNCLVFQKNRFACFYGGEPLKNALPIPEKHGAGLPCFPGGKLNPGERDLDGAPREFKEETGAALPNPNFPLGSKPKIIKIERAKENFCGVFFHVPNLAAAAGACATNLGEAGKIAAAIAAHTYSDTKVWIAEGLIDNELSPNVEIIPFADAKALFEKTGDITGWFAELIDSFFQASVTAF